MTDFIIYFLAAVFVTNSIPHLVKGLTGSRFPTPFAQPPGVGMSSPSLNIVWGWMNLIAGIGLCYWANPESIGMRADTLITAIIGGVVTSFGLARYFGKTISESKLT